MRQVQQYRRELHQIPELDRQLPKTLSYLEQHLSMLHCEISKPVEGAICAYFDFNKKETIAFRSDMDALAITECNDCAYHSSHKGRMHACGHDGHMAMLLATCDEIDRYITCNYNVLLIFQPAEETTGGAKDIVQSGVLSHYHVSCIFGFHLWPKLRFGQIASKAGPLMARSSEISIAIHGVSAHAARANEGKDALYAGVMFLHKAYAITKQIPDDRFHLLKFGKMESGTMRNVISPQTNILGTMRAFDPSTFLFMKEALLQIVDHVEHQTGCSITMNIAEGYPPLVNDQDLFLRCQKLLPEMLELTEPNMLAEDFSFYGTAAPSLFLYLGIGDTPSLHADTFDFDDSVLIKGVETYLKLLEI